LPEIKVIEDSITEILNRWGMGDGGWGSILRKDASQDKMRNENTSSVLEKKNKIRYKKLPLQGVRVLVTLGGISEKIDDVRVISNLSSGKMGYALASECQERGAEVKVIYGRNDLGQLLDKFTEKIKVEGSFDLESKLKKNLENIDLVFHVAAVSDFKIKNASRKKISSSKEIKLELTPTKKIINCLKKINPKIFLVGFKAGSGISEKNLLEKAKKLLENSKSDLVIANDVKKAGTFGSDYNEVFIVKKGEHLKGEHLKVGRSKKEEVARRIVDEVVKNLHSKS